MVNSSKFIGNVLFYLLLVESYFFFQWSVFQAIIMYSSYQFFKRGSYQPFHLFYLLVGESYFFSMVGVPSDYQFLFLSAIARVVCK